jgi:serine/threonine protein phosphatase PrpC
MMLQLFAEARTDIGLVRKNNEDNYLIDVPAGLLVVADGMGGHASGEVASTIATDIVRDYFKLVPEGRPPVVGECREDFSDMTNWIGAAIRIANTAVYEAAQSDPKLQGMGTTIAAVLIHENKLSIAHVGDSRVYLIRAGDIEQLTDDHSLVYEQVRRELITKDEAQKSDMKNILTRAVGIASDVEIDFNELTLMAGDVLILCSDGLTSMVSDDDILSTVMATDNPFEACNNLVEMANTNGGKDNVTVVAGYIRKKKIWISVLYNLRQWFRR